MTAPIHPAMMPSLTARVGRSMPVGNEGAGVVVAAGESAEAQALLGRTVGFARRQHLRRARSRRGADVPAAARGQRRRRRRVLLREPADRPRDGRDDAPRGPHRAGAHRGRLQPRPDAQPSLPRRRRAARERGSPPRAGRAAARAGGGVRLRLQHRDVLRRPRRRAQGHRRHPGVRRRRRRRPGEPDPERHGGRGDRAATRRTAATAR